MHYLAVLLLAALALGFVPLNQDAEPTRALEEGEALLRAGRLDEAEARFGEAVRLAPDLPRAQYYLGVVRLRLGRPADAVGPLETARELSARAPRTNPAVLYELGTAYLQLERYEEAAAVLELASSAVPADTGFRLQLGYAYYKLLEGEKAEAEFGAVLAKEPRNPLARFYLGLTQAALGRLSEAEASFRLALETQPDLTDARLALARTLSQSDRDEEARAELDEVLTASPEGGEAALAAHNELGLVSLRAADLDGARRHFEAVVEGRADDRQATYNLWLIYSRLGMTAEANDMKARFEAAKPNETELRSLARTSASPPKKPR
jgi:tetratricopeptide (TPR) repeat protein